MYEAHFSGDRSILQLVWRPVITATDTGQQYTYCYFKSRLSAAVSVGTLILFEQTEGYGEV